MDVTASKGFVARLKMVENRYWTLEVSADEETLVQKTKHSKKNIIVNKISYDLILKLLLRCWDRNSQYFTLQNFLSPIRSKLISLPTTIENEGQKKNIGHKRVI